MPDNMLQNDLLQKSMRLKSVELCRLLLFRSRKNILYLDEDVMDGGEERIFALFAEFAREIVKIDGPNHGTAQA